MLTLEHCRKCLRNPTCRKTKVTGVNQQRLSSLNNPGFHLPVRNQQSKSQSQTPNLPSLSIQWFIQGLTPTQKLQSFPLFHFPFTFPLSQFGPNSLLRGLRWSLRAQLLLSNCIPSDPNTPASPVSFFCSSLASFLHFSWPNLFNLKSLNSEVRNLGFGPLVKIGSSSLISEQNKLYRIEFRLFAI